MIRHRLWTLLLISVVGTGLGLAAERPLPKWEEIPAAPRWELQMLGVTDAARLAQVQAAVTGRLVRMALVGEGGLNRKRLRPHMYPGFSLVYRTGADDCPGAHDTGQIAVILDLLGALGVRVHMTSYQPPDDFAQVAAAFAAAGQEADIVVTYHSFWGENVKLIVAAMASRPQALFLAPYGEIGEPRTATSMQAHSYKPWGGGLPNLFTVAPLARRSDGSLLIPSHRDAQDTEIINFIAPSHHANGPGGTCPSVGTLAGVAVYACAAAPRAPDREALVRMLRQSVTVDEGALTSAPPFTAAHVAKLRASLAALQEPDAGHRRKVDAAGVVSLERLWRKLGGL
jgi:hypothetical protein